MKVRFSTNTFLINLFTFTVATSFFLSSCSRSAKVEAEIIPQADYVLRDMQYFMSGTDKIDTLTVQLKDTTLYNTGNDVALVKVADNFTELTKTSHFQISNLKTLPTDLKTDIFEVNIPAQLYNNGSFGYFSTKLPLSADSIHVPYGHYLSDAFSIKVPAHSRIVMNRNIQAFQLSCSFSAVIENKTSGQTYHINGNWKGILRYDGLHTKLTERPL